MGWLILIGLIVLVLVLLFDVSGDLDWTDLFPF
jgi:hypothetical protein